MNGPAIIRAVPPAPETSRRYWEMWCPTCGVQEVLAFSADNPLLVEHTERHNRWHAEQETTK